MLINDIKISGDNDILMGDSLFYCIPLSDGSPIKIYENKIVKIVQGKAFIYNAKSEDVVFQSEAHTWKIEKRSFFICARLLAFIDYARDFSKMTAIGTEFDINQKIFHIENNEGTLEHTLISEALKENSQLEPLFVTIRHSESYWLILHLISYLDEKKSNIAQIGERYGVSGTHFRRLCKRYLGNCGKSQLRSWRAASSILTTLSTDESLTQIAVDNGFSSASHFSNEIKTLFGITPTEFRRIGRFLYEYKK
ncbi:helix-turn-helix domain-containing protein [Proteus vulgaris]|uniref:helix-turn-helix domain-containing protein n=1 Tax=Proteus vulgaris TaxID=585 RepID=UPI0018E40600|nr:helix-turn-helix domain-containing protein [Proteus vulgaris]MBI6528190.1 helix-turn-helix domain-containing protein [Proteus vulgaris]